MQHSGELAETVAVLFHQFKSLGEEPERMAIEIVNEKEHVFEIWATQHGGSQLDQMLKASLDEPHVMQKMYKAWKEKKRSITIDLQGKELEDYFQYLKRSGLPVQRKIFGKRRVQNVATFSKGILTIITSQPRPQETITILERFASVFDATYTRFLDLQKAESQAREARIEAALEKVRSRSLAMHRSEELQEVVTTVFERLNELDIQTDAINLDVFNENKKDAYLWTAVPGYNYSKEIHIPYTEVAVFKDIYEGMISGKELHSKVYSRELKDQFLDYIFEHTDFRDSPKERKDRLYATIGSTVSVAYAKNTAIIAQRYRIDPFSEEENEILKRFAKVFEQCYTRFRDLQKAEAQSREAQIESSLERVRAKAMAMHQSDDLRTAVATVFDELDKLNMGLIRCGIGILDKKKPRGDIWITIKSDQGDTIQVSGDEPLDIHPLLKGAYDAWLKQEDFSYVLHDNDLLGYYQAIKKTNFQLPVSSTFDIAKSGQEQFYFNAVFQDGSLFAFLDNAFTDEAKMVMKRFANVFNLTYKRFLDLQKAEAQAREAKIEAALEKVRSSSMAMHKSDELHGVINVVTEQFQQLDFLFDTANFITNYSEQGGDWWISTPGVSTPAKMYCPSADIKLFNNLAEEMRSGTEFFTESFSLEEKDQFFDYVYEHTNLKYIPEERKKYIYAAPGIASSSVVLKNVILTVANYQMLPYSDEENIIIRRIGKVFEQSYTRFLDLKKAEAQANEAKIEASLERVRSKAMAMHSSQDLSDTIAAFYHELGTYSITPRRCGVGLINKETHLAELSTMNTTEEGASLELIGRVKLTDHPVLEGIYDNWLRQEEYHPVLKGNDIKEYYKLIRPQISFPDYPNDAVQYGYFFYFPEGGVYAWTDKVMVEDELKIYRRFTSVLSLTYKRYIDLKEAEAQANESQIQLALERVRARTMAMQKSDELADAAVVLFQQFASLGETPDRISIGIVDEATETTDVWATDQQGTQVNVRFKARNSERTTIRSMLNEWKAGKRSAIIDLQGDDLKDWISYLRNELGMTINDNYFHGRRLHQVSFFSQGWLNITTLEPLPPETLELLDRFASVFNLTYTRFVDLKRAEAQAREARVEASLERVRARAMSMHSSEDLMDTINLFYHEVEVLSITPRRCGVSLINRETRIAELSTMITTEEGGSRVAAGNLLLAGHPVLDGAFESWVAQKDFFPVLKGNEIREYYRFLTKQVDLPDNPADEKQFGYYFAFPEGLVFAWTNSELGEDALSIYRRFTSVLNLTYKRYKELKDAEERAQARLEDFKKLEEAKNKIEATLHELKATQAQLIQSEKMASLGELTAGIAHEIQNPLNFVNNFSEVSNELLDEMIEEVKKGNYSEVEVLVNDVKQNLEKINHHGKRADGIVKGMLQHSRSSSAHNEPTDINKLADEYLRLAYHGLRAKDKTFNASMHTDFDQSIGDVNIIPQDIGRVILNLITNAFYVVNEKKRQQAGEFIPSVTVRTKKEGDTILIAVKDNGKGIPQKVLDKIFQPFFTTKPTGQGTGLGLSLSYDIVKAHGGELIVATQEGVGSEFIIQLPNQS